MRVDIVIVHSGFLSGVRVAHLFSFLCCPIMCIYVLCSLLWCPLRFPHKKVFDSSLPPVVCRRAHVLFRLFVFVCVWWCRTHIVLCFCFVFLRLVYHMLPVSLDCSFLIAHSVFFNVYILASYLTLRCQSLTDLIHISHVFQIYGVYNAKIYYRKIFMAVTTLRQMMQMPHTEIDDFFYTKILFKNF